VRAEIGAFSPGLAARPHIVAVNKVDLEAARAQRSRSRRKGVLFVSAVTGDGLSELRRAMFDAVANAPAPELPALAVTKLRERGRTTAPTSLSVEKLPWGFQVRGDRIERLVERTDFDSEGAVERFQVELDRMGVNEALEAAGTQPGDTVRVGSAEFEYQP
jgi:GTP-binding protein